MSEPGQLKIQGLHHVTLIVRDLEATTGFYEGVLGLKLVDRETNADDPDARHFWFGDEHGSAAYKRHIAVHFAEEIRAELEAAIP